MKVKVYQSVFERYEKKYMLSREQYEALRRMLGGRMAVDEYGQHTICNLYYDTENFALIRRSLQKPNYKEKLRLRSYGVPGREDGVFVELKKKLAGVVYKRRVQLELEEAMDYLAGGARPRQEGQIVCEIDWFMQQNGGPAPAAFISYDRIALYGLENVDFRVTFDTGLRWRDTDLDLSQGDYGELLLPRDRVLMEIKIPGSMPLWMSRILDAAGAFPISYSKYGACYAEHLLPRSMAAGGLVCA